MTQKEIIEALQKSLTQGSGSLDDLGNLLARVQTDIEQAKKDEAAAKRKAETERGDRIAKIATRLLNDELTSDDMAFVMNSFYGSHGLQQIWDAAGIDALVGECDKQDKKIDELTNQLTNELSDLFKTLFNIDFEKDVKPNVKVEVKSKPKSKDPDDVIGDFLKKMGLK